MLREELYMVDQADDSPDSSILQRFRDAIVSIDWEDALAICDQSLAEGVDPAHIIHEGIVRAVQEVGEKFEEGEFFLPELIMTGEIITEVMTRLKPHLKDAPTPKPGKVVVGTGKGDLHDIGKNILVMFLDVAGFAVVDLGVDVSPTRFVEAVRLERPQIVAISALITRTMPEVKATVSALVEAGLRDQVKVLVGGAPITQDFVSAIGADAYGKNAVEGARICREWISK